MNGNKTYKYNTKGNQNISLSLNPLLYYKQTKPCYVNNFVK